MKSCNVLYFYCEGCKWVHKHTFPPDINGEGYRGAKCKLGTGFSSTGYILKKEE